MRNEELLEFAKQAAQNAYAPYSNFRVGACILYESGNYYCGCNVENASYGLSLCAERNAISTAITNGENSRLLKAAVYSPDSKLCTPCGACRQWLVEFESGQNIEIILEGENSDVVSYSINELLPHYFSLNK